MSAPTTRIRKITQTILYDRDRPEVPGNCVQAAVASLLDMPLDAVPHFATFDLWLSAMRLWARGHELAMHHEPTSVIPDRSCLVSGKSPRGVTHAVVADAGKVVWDPHPSRAGLLTVTRAFWFEPLTSSDGTCGTCWACGQSRSVAVIQP